MRPDCSFFYEKGRLGPPLKVRGGQFFPETWLISDANAVETQTKTSCQQSAGGIIGNDAFIKLQYDLYYIKRQLFMLDLFNVSSG